MSAKLVYIATCRDCTRITFLAVANTPAEQVSFASEVKRAVKRGDDVKLRRVSAAIGRAAWCACPPRRRRASK